MEEWFYVKNDLIEREDIKEIIQRPVWSRFGLWRPKVVIDQNDEASRRLLATSAPSLAQGILFKST
jgi:hypothetical protein